MNFSELTKIEPRLKQLYNKARQVDGSEANFCANRVWYEEFKPQLLNLVGQGAARPELQTVEAYDVAYKKIYRALPNCGEGCSCIVRCLI